MWSIYEPFLWCYFTFCGESLELSCLTSFFRRGMLKPIPLENLFLISLLACLGTSGEDDDDELLFLYKLEILYFASAMALFSIIQIFGCRLELRVPIKPSFTDPSTNGIFLYLKRSVGQGFERLVWRVLGRSGGVGRVGVRGSWWVPVRHILSW